MVYTCPLAAVQVQLYAYRLTNNPVRTWLLPSERLHAATVVVTILAIASSEAFHLASVEGLASLQT